MRLEVIAEIFAQGGPLVFMCEEVLDGIDGMIEAREPVKSFDKVKKVECHWSVKFALRSEVACADLCLCSAALSVL